MGHDGVLFVLIMEFGALLVPASEDLHGHYVQSGSLHLYKPIILYASQIFPSKLSING